MVGAGGCVISAQLPDRFEPLAPLVIIFINFFLIAVSTRFFALLSIRSALLIGSRGVVSFGIFVVLSCMRLGKQIHCRLRAGDVYPVVGKV